MRQLTKPEMFKSTFHEGDERFIVKNHEGKMLNPMFKPSALIAFNAAKAVYKRDSKK